MEARSAQRNRELLMLLPLSVDTIGYTAYARRPREPTLIPRWKSSHQIDGTRLKLRLLKNCEDAAGRRPTATTGRRRATRPAPLPRGPAFRRCGSSPPSSRPTPGRGHVPPPSRRRARNRGRRRGSRRASPRSGFRPARAVEEESLGDRVLRRRGLDVHAGVQEHVRRAQHLLAGVDPEREVVQPPVRLVRVSV